MKPSNDLNESLRTWDQARLAGKLESAQLRRRIVAAIQDDDVQPGGASPLEPGDAHRHRGIAWFGLGMAVALLIALTLTLTQPGDDPALPGGNLTSVPPDFSWLVEPQLANKRELLVEMDRVFNGQVAWIAETGEQVRIGLAPEDGFAAHDSSRRLAIRLVVTRTMPQVGQPVPVWAVDLISPDEQLVRLSGQAGSDDNLQLWTYCLPDNNNVAVDATIDLAGGIGLQTSYSGVQEIGVPQQVYAWHDDAAQYQVFQTVTYLDDEVL